jgi:predicted nucleotidyltransferase
MSPCARTGKRHEARQRREQEPPTMSCETLPKDKRDEVLRIAEKYGARHVRVFGSVARGQADDKSDIDFLVELEAGRSLLDLGGLQFELETLLARPVDVVTERGLKPRVREHVLREAIPV